VSPEHILTPKRMLTLLDRIERDAEEAERHARRLAEEYGWVYGLGLTQWTGSYPPSDPYAAWDANLDKATDEPDGFPDKAIIPYVAALRAARVVTLQSCAGHPGRDGHLWFQADLSHDALGFLLASAAITHVRRLYKPEDCWEIIFGDLYGAMAYLFTALLIPMPQKKGSAT
jgi:hypothetical protein